MASVAAVRHLPSETLANQQIQDAIALKIEEYPGKICKEQHVAHAYVPVGVAALLRDYPTLVAPAVHAFCSRDRADNKVLRMMRHFPPETRVLTAVKFSKALFAQLVGQVFQPDARTGWKLPAPSDPAFKIHDVGMKLACGFEILVSSAGGVTPSSTPCRETPEEDVDVSSNPLWFRYKQSLADKGYFRGELEGSQLYGELEQGAKQFFVANLMTSDSITEGVATLSLGAMIVKLMGKVNADMDFFKEREKRLVAADDDAWLQISPDALDELLESRYAKCDEKSRAKVNSDAEVAKVLSSFLGHVSDMEGAEVPQDLQEKLRKLSSLSTGRKASGEQRKSSCLFVNHPQLRKVSAQSNVSDGSTTSDMSSFSNKIDFSADSFTDALANVLDLAEVEDDYWDNSEDESSGLSSYGGEGEKDADVGSRKSSNTSNKSDLGSCASSGIDTDMKDVVRQMEKELADSAVTDHLESRRRDPPAGVGLDSDDDEFGDVESFEPVKVDMQAVRDLVKAYREEKGGTPGPSMALFTSLGVAPDARK